jgi:hypothetical protein
LPRTRGSTLAQSTATWKLLFFVDATQHLILPDYQSFFERMSKTIQVILEALFCSAHVAVIFSGEQSKMWNTESRRSSSRTSSMIRPVVVAAMIMGAPFAIQQAAAADITTAPDKPMKAPKVSIVDVPFFSVNDNRLTYSYIPDATDPGVSKTAKQVYSFTHFDAWAYGTNFFAISMFKSDHCDPANPCPVFGTNCAGTTDIYALVRSTFGWNEIFDTKAFSIGPLRNISFEVGADAGQQITFLLRRRASL